MRLRFVNLMRAGRWWLAPILRTSLLKWTIWKISRNMRPQKAIRYRTDRIQVATVKSRSSTRGKATRSNRSNAESNHKSYSHSERSEEHQHRSSSHTKHRGTQKL